jgi:hypothetical protein
VTSALHDPATPSTPAELTTALLALHAGRRHLPATSKTSTVARWPHRKRNHDAAITQYKRVRRELSAKRAPHIRARKPRQSRARLAIAARRATIDSGPTPAAYYLITGRKTGSIDSYSGSITPLVGYEPTQRMYVGQG